MKKRTPLAHSPPLAMAETVASGVEWSAAETLPAEVMAWLPEASGGSDPLPAQPEISIAETMSHRMEAP